MRYAHSRIGGGTAVAIIGGMDCYFGACPLPKENDLGKSAIVLFHIPELGVRFKAPFDAVNHDHADLASLLALLEFIESNPKYFKEKSFRIYGNNLKVVNQINGREPVPDLLSGLVERAVQYRPKLKYSLAWVSQRNNPAFDMHLE